MIIVGHCPPPLPFSIFCPTGQFYDFTFLYVVDYEREQKYNSVLPGQKLQELKTALATSVPFFKFTVLT